MVVHAFNPSAWEAEASLHYRTWTRRKVQRRDTLQTCSVLWLGSGKDIMSIRSLCSVRVKRWLLFTEYNWSCRFSPVQQAHLAGMRP